MSVPFHHGRALPLEVLESIAFELVAAEPLGTPRQLLPLLLTSRAIHSALSIQSGTPLYSRICRFKFDIGAVTRRAFTPGVKDLNGHLIQMSSLLSFIRKGDISGPDVPDQLLIAYIAMLDNDGKNRAQLKHAGIEDFVDRLVRLRLHEGIEANDMWPEANVTNSCALWLMWMFTTRESLQRETPQQREAIIRLVFPIIACPFRYACSLIPPNHFTLPLGKSNPVQSDLFTTETAHGPYPLYHIIRSSPQTVIWYFRCNASFLSPLITPVAKLLYWSRREIHPFFQNPILPATRAGLGRAGLTQEDLADFNRHKVAKLIDDVIWDWDIGAPVCRTVGEDGVSVFKVWKEDESVKWDRDWWRARLCGDVFFKQPKWRLGSVYMRGMLTGQWQGVQFTRSVASLNEMLVQARRPSGFSEENIFFGARPLLMRLTEHGFVRTPSTRTSRGPVPHASPATMSITVSTPGGGHGEALVSIDASLNNAWWPGPPGSLRWVEGGERLDEGVLRDRYVRSGTRDGEEAMSSTTFIVSSSSRVGSGVADFTSAEVGGPVDARVAAAAASVGGGNSVYVYEAYEAGKESVHERMVRAKQRGELSERQAGEGGEKRVATHPGCVKCEDRETFLGERRERDVRRRGRGALPSSSSGVQVRRRAVEDLFSSVGMGKRGRMFNDGDEEEDGMDLDAEDGDEDVVEFGFDEGEDEGVDDDEDTDMASILASTVPPSRSVSATRSSSRDVFDGDAEDQEDEQEEEEGDNDNDDDTSGMDVDFDYEQGYPGVRDSAGTSLSDPLRRSHDRYRVEECDGGVEDVVVTGDLSEQHRMAWGKSVYYGRVRPWDGLIAILRIAHDRNSEMNGHMIYYGYIYGGDTFVGNWKSTGMDPLMPGFECSFVMSRRTVA